MSRRSTLGVRFGVAAVVAWGCQSAAGTASGPANPRPVIPPAPASAPVAGPARAGASPLDNTDILPIRAEQAPLVSVRDLVDGKIPLGRRVRVSGRCLEAGAGRSAGLWTLVDDEAQIEVRGLVPDHCPSKLGETLTIFAQVERRKGTPERLLLRLPG